MLPEGTLGLFVGAVALGAVHGIEPGHGWPVAASYAFNQTNRWLYGLAASLILGVGHLASSIAMVGVFFYAKSYFSLTQLNEPITVLGGIRIGGPVSLVAGVLLVGLGVREYRHGHTHGNEEHSQHEGHDHDSAGHNSDHSHGGAHDHARAHKDAGLVSRLKVALPTGGHSGAHEGSDDVAERGLFGIAWFAFLLGFAHEEEFEIIALCAGSKYCLELMIAYAVAVIVGIVGLTMLLIAGYQHHEEKVRQYTPYLPVLSAAVLIVIGAGFIAGLF